MTDERVKYLFVASTRGHLAQLMRLSSGFNPADDSLWVTFRSPQSEDLLAGRRTMFVPYVRSRDIRGVFRAWRQIRALLARESFDRVVSTGAAVALSALPTARLRGIPTLYVESVSRVRGPSLTGRLIAFSRTAELQTQHPGWARGRWSARASVFGTYRAVPRATVERPSLFVTLGTIRGYRFDSVVDAVLSTGLADNRTVWQVGETTRAGLPGTIVEQTSTDEFRDLATRSDVVVTHAGVGTILDLLELGIHPVVVPRRKHRKEHVDDHQEQIAELVDLLGVAHAAESTSLTAADIIAASGMTVVHAEGS